MDLSNNSVLFPENTPGNNKSLVLLGLPLLISVFLTLPVAEAQEAPATRFEKVFGGDSYEYITDIVVENDGFLVGAYSNSLPSGTKTSPNKGGNDFWIIKTATNGAKLWERTYGGPHNDELQKIIKTSDGGYLLAGSSSSPKGGDKTAPLKSSTTADSDFWIVKISSAGTKLWDKSFGSTENDVLADAIATEDGGFLLVGSSNSQAGGDKTENVRPGLDQFDGRAVAPDFWVIKINANGLPLWDKTLGGTGDALNYTGTDLATSVVKGLDDGYLIGGSSNAELGFEKSYARGNYDFWVIKLSSSGVKEWDRPLGGDGSDHLTDIEVLPHGYLLGGSTNQSYGGDKTEEVFGPGPNPWTVYIDQASNKIFDHGPSAEHTPFDYAADSSGYYFTSSFRGVSLLNKVSWQGVALWQKNISSQLGLGFPPVLTFSLQHELITGITGDSDAGGFDIALIKLYPEILNGNYLVDIATSLNVNNYIVDLAATPYTPSSILKVEFYAGGIKFAEDRSSPYRGGFANPGVGVHRLSAKVYLSSGTVIESPTRLLTLSQFPQKLAYQAVNLNGPSTTIGNVFFRSSSGLANFTYSGKTYANQSIRLVPAPDDPTAALIRSSIYSTKTAPALFTFSNVPSAFYEVYLYVWEDNNRTTYTISINGISMTTVSSGQKGNWEKLGPFKLAVNSGKIEIKAEGGDANISAIEINQSLNYQNLYRAVNVNGPALKVDGLQYQAGSAPNFIAEGKLFSNQSIQLIPPAEQSRATMIRSCVYALASSPAVFTFTNVPTGNYDLYFYVWEDNFPASFQVSVNGVTDPTGYNTFRKGEWKLLGPFSAATSSGKIELKITGGDGNVSGIEIWKHKEVIGFAENSTVNTLRVHPNPASSYVTVELGKPVKGLATFTILDDFGKVFFNRTKMVSGERSVDLIVPAEKMKAGLFLLKVQTENETKTIRLIVR